MNRSCAAGCIRQRQDTHKAEGRHTSGRGKARIRQRQGTHKAEARIRQRQGTHAAEARHTCLQIKRKAETAASVTCSSIGAIDTLDPFVFPD